MKCINYDDEKEISTLTAYQFTMSKFWDLWSCKCRMSVTMPWPTCLNIGFARLVRLSMTVLSVKSGRIVLLGGYCWSLQNVFKMGLCLWVVAGLVTVRTSCSAKIHCNLQKIQKTQFDDVLHDITQLIIDN